MPATPRPCAYCGNTVTYREARVIFCSVQCKYAQRRRDTEQAMAQVLGESLETAIPRLLNEGLKMREIAERCGIHDPTFLLKIMRRLNIPMRSRSDSVRLQWANNETRRAAFGQQIREWQIAHPDQVLANSVQANLACQSASPTSIERRMMEALDTAGIPYVFQYVVGDKFLCDLAFPDHMLIVECDGTYWHNTVKQRRRDSSKDAYLQACGYTVLRFSDTQIERDVTACVHAIQALTIRPSQ